jgi:TetR/AcrR family transcriptional regulator
MRWKESIPSKAQLRDAKRDAVLREAALAFNRNGFHGTSLDDVAQRLGVTKATLYYYFPNKQAVLRACCEQSMEFVFKNLERACEQGHTGRERLMLVISGFIEYLAGEVSVSVMMLEEDTLDVTDRAAVTQLRDRFEHALRELVREGITDGSIVPCDPKLVVFALLGATNWVTRWFRGEGSWTRAQVAAAITEFCERALNPAPPAALATQVGGRKTRRTAHERP